MQNAKKGGNTSTVENDESAVLPDGESTIIFENVESDINENGESTSSMIAVTLRKKSNLEHIFPFSVI